MSALAPIVDRRFRRPSAGAFATETRMNSSRPAFHSGASPANRGVRIRKGALLIPVVACLLSQAAFAQGQFRFDNRSGDASEGSLPFLLCTDLRPQSSIAGSDWQVQLFGGPTGTLPAELQPLEPAATSFRTGIAAGYVLPVTVSVPNVGPGQSADVLLRVVYVPDQAVLATFGPFPTELGRAGEFAPVLGLGNDLLLVCIPEPRVWALAVFGIAIWCPLARHRSRPSRPLTPPGHG